MHLPAHPAFHSSIAHGNSYISIARRQSFAFIGSQIRIDRRAAPLEKAFRAAHQPLQISTSVLTMDRIVQNPRLGRIGFRRFVPTYQQRLDTATVSPYRLWRAAAPTAVLVTAETQAALIVHAQLLARPTSRLSRVACTVQCSAAGAAPGANLVGHLLVNCGQQKPKIGIIEQLR